MIRKFDDVFKLDTKNTTYLIRVSKFNHILNDYYGRKILDESFDFSKEKYNAPSGTAVNYSEEDFNYVLDTLSLEISSPYKGDYKEPSLIVDNSRHPQRVLSAIVECKKRLRPNSHLSHLSYTWKKTYALLSLHSFDCNYAMECSHMTPYLPPRIIYSLD